MVYFELIRKPEKINNGKNVGPIRPIVAFIFGVTTAKNVPFGLCLKQSFNFFPYFFKIIPQLPNPTAVFVASTIRDVIEK